MAHEERYLIIITAASATPVSRCLRDAAEVSILVMSAVGHENRLLMSFNASSGNILLRSQLFTM